MTAHSIDSIHRLSVIVPQNPFAPAGLQEKKHCLSALNVEKLMEWWPGTPHTPHRSPKKVTAIQRSLDWKRVVQIAAYLLQREIVDAPDKLDKYFRDIYEPRKNEPGREWPPKINRVIGFEPSEFPMFSNVLLHVNGAEIEEVTVSGKDAQNERGAAHLTFDENSEKLNFQVIDGQHRINGAFLAVKILQEERPEAKWEIPAEIFLDLDPADGPPKRQAQIFIDVNFYQKKVDRSLVADLFPTARGEREPLSMKERAQDIGRKLMLETGPLVGMVQIPGIKYGVKDVITLATLNGAIEDILEALIEHDISSLDEQSEFIAQSLQAWLEASGRFERPKKKKDAVDSESVVYQGRVLVSILTLIPAMIWKLRKEKVTYISDKAKKVLTAWLKDIAAKANLLDHDVFIDKSKFRERGYLGSGGIGRFRDTLWAAIVSTDKLRKNTKNERIHELAEKGRHLVLGELQKEQN